VNKKNIRFIIDEGNTFIKVAAYEGEEWLFFDQCSKLSDDFLEHLFSEIHIERKQEKPKAIYASTRSEDVLTATLLSQFFDILQLNSETSVPIKNLYQTPESLGVDRLAAVIGASALFKNQDLLVIDAGTCITYDFINAKKYYFGGGIMPGFQMKLQALHTFTGKLPLINVKAINKLFGSTTIEAMQVGTVDATILGLDAIIEQFKQKFPSLKIILCGGDSRLLQDMLKNHTFAEPKLVLHGLKKILDFNEDS
jgi:type III pantothenate kinase